MVHECQVEHVGRESIILKISKETKQARWVWVGVGVGVCVCVCGRVCVRVCV